MTTPLRSQLVRAPFVQGLFDGALLVRALLLRSRRLRAQLLRALLPCTVGLAACTGAPHLSARWPSADGPFDETPAAAGRQDQLADHHWERLEAADGTELFAQCWAPRDARPAALLVVVHGLKDHSSRYRELARVMVPEGVAVCAMDHRGHGRSAGRRADVASFDPYLEDLTRFVSYARERSGADVPLFLFGHSMGGALAALLVLEERVRDVRGVILSAPALRISRPPFEIAATGALASLAPNAPAVDLPNEHFSRDPEVVRAMADDPLIYASRHSARFGGAFVDGLARVWRRPEAFDVPLLVLHGTEDRATDPRGSVELVERLRAAGRSDATLELYEGLYHDLLHEPEREAILATVRGWLVARIGGGR
ncbi:MAG: lysophospholipase [Myxococcales bacterium]|nr:lysophospholipase [Myxococcales bacterium]